MGPRRRKFRKPLGKDARLQHRAGTERRAARSAAERGEAKGAGARKGAEKGREVFIDAENLVLGRMASAVAKRLLNGESITIFNAEKAVIVGGRDFILAKFAKRRTLRRKGNPHFSPKMSRMPDRIVRRAVRGMLPHKKERGINAFRRLKSYMGKPSFVPEGKGETIEPAQNNSDRFLEIGEISKVLGAKF
ncbi:MAG: 50S ribosomal protein L13 [Candidatus Diapherotrites archaeon]